MAYHEFGYKNCTGEELFACSWEVEGKSLVNVVLVHGLGEHVGRYKEVSEFLMNHGCNVYAFDQLGFGRSPGKRGHISSFKVYLDDLHRFIQIIKDPWNRKKTLILGHSLGGLLGLVYGIKYPHSVDGFIISSPALKSYPIPKNLEWILKVCSVVAPRITVKNQLAADKLSHDSAVVEAYREDPLVHNQLTPRFARELMRVIDFAQMNAQKFLDPLLLLYAGQDKIVNPEGVGEFVSRLVPEVTKEVICYEELYHEIFNESMRGEILLKIDQWIKALVESDQVINS